MMSLNYVDCQSGQPVYTDWQQPTTHTLNYVEWQQPQPPYVGPESYRQPYVQWQPPYQTQPQQMQSGHQTIDYYQPPFYPQPPDPPDWQCQSTDPVTPDLAPNLSMAALVSQLERLTADVEQLVSRMDAKERRLGNPHAAVCPPPAPTFSVHQPLRSASHYSAAPYTVQPHIDPDIAGSLQQPPTQRSPPCSHDIRYGSIESLPDDIDAHESVQSRQIHHDVILSAQLLNRDPLGDDEVLLEVEKFMQVANEKQCDLDLSNVIAQAKDVIHSSVEGSFSMELIVKEVDSGFERNGSDKKWEYADNTGKHNTVGISHCSTTLDTDARLIPPRIDTKCLGIPGCVDKLHFWTLNNHNHDMRVGQVEGVDEMLQTSNSGIYQSLIEPWSRTIRQKDVFSTPAHPGDASQRNTGAVEDNTLEQVYGTRWFARLAGESANILKGSNWFLPEWFVVDLQHLKKNWEEGLYALVAVSGVTNVEDSKSNDEEHGDLRENAAADLPGVDISKIEMSNFIGADKQINVDVFDPASDCVKLRESILDFQIFRKLFSSLKLTLCYFALHGDAGAYARRVFVEELGAKESSLLNCAPKEDFGRGHPDHNLIYARELVAHVGLSKSDNTPNPPEFGAAADGDVDHNMDFGKGFFVAPSDFVAIVAAYVVQAISYFPGGLIAVVAAYVRWVLPDVKFMGVEPVEANAMVLSLHLDRRVELDQARDLGDRGTVMELDKEIFLLCSKELTGGMYLVSHSSICASIKNKFEGIWSILKLPLVGAEIYCVDYGLKGANGVTIITGADWNFSGLRLMITLADVVQLYWQLTSMGIELLVVFHGSQIFELKRLLATWFPP